MKGIKYMGIIALLLLVSADASYSQSVYGTNSPDKSTRLEISTGVEGQLQYRVIYEHKEVVKWSALGFRFNGIAAGEHAHVLKNIAANHTETFNWPLGENDKIENNYSEQILQCRSGSLQFTVTGRVFNGSIAFRYGIPGKEASGNIQQENTQFNFTYPYVMYQYHQETVFTPVIIDSLKGSCDFPATLVNRSKLYITIGEADNRGYTKAELKKGGAANSLAVSFIRDTAVKINGAFQSPWRTVSISKTAIGLHNYSDLFLKLNPPPKEVPAWIKPGKLIRAQLNTQSGLDCIDFAVKHNFQYIMFDGGWYGPERSPKSNPLVAIPAIDMPRVIQYGKDKGIGVLLYVNYVGLRTHLDSLLPTYKKWGVKGFKFGFVDGLTQDGLSWLANAIKKVYDNGFVLDIHDNYKPTGLSRSYPSLLTQEGIRGDENSPDAFHTTVLPFTRFLAGPADFTFCYPNSKSSFSKNLKVSKGQQLALTVVYFSPLQSIFWYGQPNDYTNEEEIEFFKYVPTVWDETHYLSGEIGENISVARKKQNTWYIGNVAGLADWHTTIKLSFLERDKAYTATIYEDDDKGGIRKRGMSVKKGDAFAIDLKAKGGQAVIIRPQ
jgi:alpha-glucosidase